MLDGLLVEGRGEVDVRERLDVEARDLCAAPFQLECPEPITAADVERPLPSKTRGKAVNEVRERGGHSALA
jgi:hypothetical protein